MKKTKLALAITASAFIASPALATNGTNMVGLGAQSAATGGTGVAAYYGAENVIVNPGLIGKAQGTEFSFGGTIFMPNVTNDGSGAGSKATSDANMNLIPSVSLASRINDQLTFGIGMYGTSGMGVDYSKSSNQGVMEAQSNMQIMRFAPSIAFNQSNFGVGFSPIIQYGSLDINYDMNGATGADGVTTYNQVGSGMASDLGMGFSIGGYFDINNQLTIAASYTSAINMKYDGQLSSASKPFVGAQSLESAFGDELEQPAELKLGAAYTMGNMLYTADFKQIAWGSAKGYKDFNWEDQNVIALGAKYSANNYWAGIGLNHGNNPIKEMGTSERGGLATNMFNNLFFPATTETHITFGGGYNLTKHVSLDAAIVYAPEVKTTVKAPQGMNIVDNTTTHSQMGYTFSARYNF